jgi:hypothetical protein
MKERVVRHSKEELKRLKGKTDFVRVQNTSDRDIERQIKKDPDCYIPTDEELKGFRPVDKEGKQ